MTTPAGRILSDTSTWLPLEQLAPGFDANKAETTSDLDGRTVTVRDERGTRIAHAFSPGKVTWTYDPGPGDDTEAGEHTDSCEVIRVDQDLYHVQFHHEYLPNEAVTLVLDLRSGHALAVLSIILDEADRQAGQTRVTHVFVPSIIEGVEQRGEAPAPTTELIGRRVEWVYSEQHAYEHIYLSPHWYTWQCLAGPERGLADTDENTAWRLRPGIYLFAWREKVIPCASVTIADHRDAHHLRSHGVLFGLDQSGTTPTHFTFGANGRLVSDTSHSAQYDPARGQEQR